LSYCGRKDAENPLIKYNLPIIQQISGKNRQKHQSVPMIIKCA
jgi:hypothetical protein